MDFADVLIVIPCLNEEAYLSALLATLCEDTPGALIVVADGGSSDGSRAIVERRAARDPGVVLMDNPARIQSAGVNAAVVRHGIGRTWLVRVDAHCDYPRHYVAMLVERAQRGDVTSVVVPMVTRARDGHCFQRGVAAAQNSVLGTGGSAHRHAAGGGRMVDHGHHALMAIDRFLDAGGYCEQLSHNEDFELDHRLRARGGAIWLETAAAIDYFPRASAGALFRQYTNYGRGKARVAMHHRTPLKPRQMLPLLVVPAVVGAVLAPSVGMLGLSVLGWLMAVPALCWLLGSLGFGLLLALRQRSACVAWSGVAAAIMHFAWGIGFIAQSLGSRGARLTPGLAPGMLPGQVPRQGPSKAD